MKKLVGMMGLLLAVLLPNSCTSAHGNLKFPEGKNEVEIPFTLYRNWIVIKVTVNDTRELSFILDTGAPIAILGDENLGKQLNLTMAGEMKVKGGDDHQGRSVPLANKMKFNIGGIQIEDGLMAIGLGSDVFAGVDGVIGKYLFDHAVVRIKWNERKIMITRRGRFSYKGDGIVLPLHLTKASHIFAEVKVNNRGKEVAFNAIVDIGKGSAFTLDQYGRKALGIGETKLSNVRIGRGVNGAFFGDMTRTDISLGTFLLKDVPTSLKANPEDIEPDNIHASIGGGALNRFDIILDFGGQQMILEKNDNYSRPFTFNQTGIFLEALTPKDVMTRRDVIYPSGTFLMIEAIVPASPAFENGLAKGDRILSVNGVKVGDLSVSNLDELVGGIGGEDIEFEIQRGTDVVKKKFKTKSLF